MTVNFQGISTHFHHGILAGVPHRVVHVEGSTAWFGEIRECGKTKPTHYMICPHKSALTCESSPGFQFNAPGFIDPSNGRFITRSHLFVKNATEQGVAYPPDDEGISTFEKHVIPLTSLKANYSFSSEVVMNGRAGVYFDVFAGSIQATPRPFQVSATIQTAGPPVIRVLPIVFSDTPGAAEITLPTDTAVITLSNESFYCQNFDFLLHLVTGRAGIPRQILEPIESDEHCTPAKAVEQLQRAIQAGYPATWPDSSDGTPPNDSCSDSRYP